eukprot:TRINITY_DN7446_c0_g1_i1.p1 TRINITY_DN7446_c0_g1~~TRINITY_DN7446_c0_g1_i1.p1  ORF type:complete len:188 (-),score=8.05 TRINITY_DN7446_c0_g1_i1:18-581(-)
MAHYYYPSWATQVAMSCMSLRIAHIGTVVLKLRLTNFEDYIHTILIFMMFIDRVFFILVPVYVFLRTLVALTLQILSWEKFRSKDIIPFVTLNLYCYSLVKSLFISESMESIYFSIIAFGSYCVSLILYCDVDMICCQHLILSLIHISEPTRPLYISYAVFCLKKKKKKQQHTLNISSKYRKPRLVQ